jgi:hypothetical protein
LSWSFGTVAFPFGPLQIAFIKTPNEDKIQQSDVDPVVVVDGFETSVQLTGSIGNNAKSDSELWSTYLTPMIGQIGTIITVVSGNGSIDGSWYLRKFEPKRTSAVPVYDYTMVLSKVSTLVTL